MTFWFNTVRDLTIQLVRWPSVTNTAGERDLPFHLRDWLATTPYFRANPTHLRVERTTNDAHERANLYALVRGSGAATVVLVGHFDVVSIANYGQLEPWACDPEALLPRLIAELAAHAHSAADQKALQDLLSGDYLPGRGALDMKSGLAAGLAVLLHFASQPERYGNLLFVTTPDEEEASNGARSAVLQLPELAREWDLDLLAAINLDASSDHGDGSMGQAAFLGTVGKFLPAVYIVGHDTHAGYPFDGINPNLLAAAITQRIECNVALCDEVADDCAPPPTSLKQTDLKTYYDVTTPSAAWCYFNYLTVGRPASTVLALFIAEVRSAIEAVLLTQYTNAQHYAARTGAITTPWQATVLSFAELHERALRSGGAATETALQNFMITLLVNPMLDAPTWTRRIVEFLWTQSGLAGPAAVVCFGSLHYPHSLVGSESPHERRLLRVVQAATAQLAAERATPISVRSFFTGISDMSFYGSAMTTADQAVVVENTPLWGAGLQFDYTAVRRLNMPIVNIGPWGRDYHQRLERLYLPYSCETLPELIWRVASGVLADDSEVLLDEAVDSAAIYHIL